MGDRSLPDGQAFIDWLQAGPLSGDNGGGHSNGTGPAVAPAVNGARPALDDGDIVKRATGSKNGSKFSRLFYEGDIGEYDGDESRADLALCDMLAFWSGDGSQVDRLFRRSALWRPKWDEKRGAHTYGQLTIGRALEAVTEVYQPGRLSSDNGAGPGSMSHDIDGGELEEPAGFWHGVDLGPGGLPASIVELPGSKPAAVEFVDQWRIMGPDVLSEPVKPTRYIVERVIREASLNMLAADSGSYKSLLLADKLVCIAGGIPWLPGVNGVINGQGVGFQVEQRNCLWLDCDNGRTLTRRRFRALLRGHNLPADTPIYAVSMPTGPALVATDSAAIRLLGEYIERYQIGVMVIDNLAAISGDVDENTAAMSRVLFPLRNLVDFYGLALTLVHHTNKALGQYRGSTAIRAALDLLLTATREPGVSVITVKTDKARDLPTPTITAEFHFEHEENGYDLARAWFTGAGDTRRRVLAVMLGILRDTGEVWLSELADHTYTACKALGSRAAVREMVKELAATLPGVELVDAGRGRVRVKSSE